MSATAAYSASFLLLTTTISPMFDTPTTSATQLKVEPQGSPLQCPHNSTGPLATRTESTGACGGFRLLSPTENAGEHCVRACSYQVEDIDWNNGNWFADGQAAKATTALL
ncbi:hypothetical protein B0H11DRAFT_1943874 [Mycena galericulata]|nr:hypothetical protein B0H11DRAFT_1943874 [Mycena galericulata]